MPAFGDFDKTDFLQCLSDSHLDLLDKLSDLNCTAKKKKVATFLEES
jgi:hypothetical protein